ncbi:DUF881 domain-containing protein [Haloimpatiens sp. FM7330]|uniref:DUF881 domain-containing protein n=1 Tax=Haloimpatiens sp. FM7330 TaxID=3298610 RepID=UPI003633E160
MRTNEIHIFVFVASIILGLLISLNINFKKETNIKFLTVDQYQDAYSERNKLYNDISNLRKQYEEYNSKYSKYRYSEKNKYEISNDIQEELDENKTKLGMTDVEGQGIEIRLNDAIEEYNETSDKLYLIHDYDIMFLLNDLKNAGVEAISVNGQRVIDGNYDYCGGPYINFNGIKIVAPFYIKAIGNKEVINKFMLMDENYLKGMMVGRKIKVDIQMKDNVKINAYIGQKSYKHAREVIQNK